MEERGVSLTDGGKPHFPHCWQTDWLTAIYLLAHGKIISSDGTAGTTLMVVNPVQDIHIL
jgi:hypothetical protein